MATKLPPFLLSITGGTGPAGTSAPARCSFLEAGLRQLVAMLKGVFLQAEWAGGQGLLQSTDSRVKLLFLLFFVVIISLKKESGSEVGIALFLLALCLSSRIALIPFYGRILFLAFFFGFLIALPSAFNVILPGKVILTLVTFNEAPRLLGYGLPQVVGITEEGLSLILLLTLRVANSLTVSLLVLSTTPFSEFIRALRIFRIPESLLLTLTLSFKYTFILLRAAEDMFLARKSRVVGVMAGAEERVWAAGRLSLLLKKAHATYEEVYRAMEARGFHGTVTLSRPQERGAWTAAPILLGGGLFFLWL